MTHSVDIPRDTPFSYLHVGMNKYEGEFSPVRSAANNSGRSLREFRRGDKYKYARGDEGN